MYYTEYDATVATQQSFWLIFYIFLTTFWRLSDGFRLTWPIKIQGVLEAESWMWRQKNGTHQSCQKDVKN